MASIGCDVERGTFSSLSLSKGLTLSYKQLTGRMGRLQIAVIAGLGALALAACSTGGASPGTASAPDVAWTPPANVNVGARSSAPATPVVPEGGTLSLAQIIDVALSNNPTTRTAWLEARAAEAALGSERSAYFPEVDVLASATRSRPPGEGVSASTTIAPSLALTYLLFDFGGRDAQVEQARQTLIAADFAHNAASGAYGGVPGVPTTTMGLIRFLEGE